jgi:hypothetical protein
MQPFLQNYNEHLQTRRFAKSVLPADNAYSLYKAFARRVERRRDPVDPTVI